MSLDDDLDDLGTSAPVVYLGPQPQLALRPPPETNVLRFAKFAYSCKLKNNVVLLAT